VRIPLDLYKVSGVPIQATPEQIHQAFTDRLQQQPSHQHSEIAIAGRKRLLEAAHNVLSDPEQRRAYDASFLSQVSALESKKAELNSEHSSEQLSAERRADAQPDKSDPNGTQGATQIAADTFGVEIQDNQLSGALLLLYELGEYDLALELGKPYLSHGILDLKRPFAGSALSESDIVLTVALCYQELGREQWQQAKYERASQSLQEGLDLLLREGLFVDVQNQIRSDQYRLRPYRILELVAFPQGTEERKLGLTLLREMLSDREGIDGAGNDQSGLSIDEFLKFIQQLRGYLTVAEQQEIFEAESRRPSAVGTYLAVYTLIARGFAQMQPALIRRAKAMLRRLNIHQDVYLEQASCTLLLGQTEEAMQALEQSRDHKALAFIRELSVESPDLLPGLYHYTQRWLQDEVYPQFQDLAGQAVELDAYFGDQQIQTYLDELVSEAPVASSGQPSDGLSLDSLSDGSITESLRTSDESRLASALADTSVATPALVGAGSSRKSWLDTDWRSSQEMSQPADFEDIEVNYPSQNSDVISNEANSLTSSLDSFLTSPREPLGTDTYARAQGTSTSRSRTGNTRSMGNSPTPDLSLDDYKRPTGSRLTDNRSAGNRAFESNPTGGRPTGNRSTGSRTTGDRSAGSRPTGNRPTGSRSLNSQYSESGLEQPTGSSVQLLERTPTSQARLRSKPPVSKAVYRLRLGSLIALAALGAVSIAAIASYVVHSFKKPAIVTSEPAASSVASAPAVTQPPLIQPQPNRSGAASPGQVVSTGGAPSGDLKPGEVQPGGVKPEGTGAAAPTAGASGAAPAAAKPADANSAELNKDTAKQVVQAWQGLKAEAMGKGYAADKLSTVLTEPALSDWKNSANLNRDQQSHMAYQLHNLQIQSVKMSTPDRAEILARIDETGDFYSKGQRQPGASYQKDSYLVKYQLVRQNNRWLIKSMKKIS
jgi:hypothetical protein